MGYFLNFSNEKNHSLLIFLSRRYLKKQIGRCTDYYSLQWHFTLIEYICSITPFHLIIWSIFKTRSCIQGNLFWYIPPIWKYVHEATELSWMTIVTLLGAIIKKNGSVASLWLKYFHFHYDSDRSTNWTLAFGYDTTVTPLSPSFYSHPHSPFPCVLPSILLDF